MDLRGYLRAIRLNWWIVVVVVVLGTLGGVFVVHRSTRVYAGQVTFFVASPGSPTSASVSGDLTAAEDLAVSYARLLSSDRLAMMVANAEPSLHLNAGQVSGKISGTAELNTVLLNATVHDTSRVRLKVLTRAVAIQFPLLVHQLNSASSRVTLNVTSGPTVGSAPVSPRSRLDVALGLLVGLVLGLGLAVGRFLLDTSVRSTEVLSEITRRPSIGSVPYDAQAKRAPLVNAGQEHSTRAEAFRQIRTNLKFIDAARPLGAFIVSSSVQGEGKSSTASNLALVFAESGLTVMLVEADMRRPRTSDYLGLERAVGLSNVLANQVELADVTQQWGDSSLSFLPSGSLPPNPSELLGSQRMSDLLVRLRRDYDLVIIDTPPLLPVTDAAVLATQVDGVVLIARHGKTRRAQLHAAAQTLESVNARLLGVVLNMTRRERNARYDYASYGDEVEAVRELPVGVAVAPATVIAAGHSDVPPTAWTGTVPSSEARPTVRPPEEVLRRKREDAARRQMHDAGPSTKRRRANRARRAAGSEGADDRRAGAGGEHGGDIAG